jgi:hypothetical protein
MLCDAVVRIETYAYIEQQMMVKNSLQQHFFVAAEAHHQRY